jgi:hypothetical protein
MLNGPPGLSMNGKFAILLIVHVYTGRPKHIRGRCGLTGESVFVGNRARRECEALCFRIAYRT